MPPTASSHNDNHDTISVPELQRAGVQSAGGNYVDIAPSRLLLFNAQQRHPGNEPTNQHREELYERALAMLGGPLRPQLHSMPTDHSHRSVRHLSNQTSQNGTSPALLMINLPVDLLLVVLDFLDWESLITFRLTNKFFAELVMTSNLKAHYSRCRDQTAREEEWLVKEGSKRFTSRSTLGALYGETLRAQALMGDMKRMPCYRCLRWFRCPTSKVLKESRRSVFSDLMAKSKDREGVDRHVTRSRLCFDCGIKTGYYHKGGQFKRFIICTNCGKLGRDLQDPPVEPFLYTTADKSLWFGMKLRYRYYCNACVEQNRFPATYAEHTHLHGHTYRYEKAMWQKRETCLAKRKALGRAGPDDKNHWEVWCPILAQNAICGCAKDEDSWRKHYNAYMW